MAKNENCLIEIGVEELPPVRLKRLMTAFKELTEKQLEQQGFEYQDIIAYATPRRLSLWIKQLQQQTAAKEMERRGPGVKAAFDDAGKPTPACVGFAKSCGCEVDELERVQTDKGEWLIHRFTQTGKTIQEHLPSLVNNALNKLPIAKRMRWSDLKTEFVRPVHWVVLLYGSETIEGEVLGVKTGKNSYGHRFHHPKAITLGNADEYLEKLRKAYVLACPNERQTTIKQQVMDLAKKHHCKAVIDDALLDEVTALVEWPVALLGEFSEDFLQLPPEVLIIAMKSHQRYFHLLDKQDKLAAKFITVSNIESIEPQQVVIGNQRVINARLSDAQFFYEQDLKHSLETFLEQEKNVVFQAKLGNLYEKSERIAKLAKTIAAEINCDQDQAERAGMLCKADLMCDMVGEFPELQGVMGRDYAKHHHEQDAIAITMEQHYWPKFSGDKLPDNAVSQAVALADRIDTIVGIIGIGLKPTGEKDPFALRRAALGILRIMIEGSLLLDLKQLLLIASQAYPSLSNKDIVDEAFDYIMERLKTWYADRGVSSDVFAAVIARQPTYPLDFDKRIKAVTEFRRLPEAQALAAANKRVMRLLTKQTNGHKLKDIDNNLFENDAEKDLVALLAVKQKEVSPLYEKAQYQQALSSLASLRDSVDRFFDEVMVMVDDEKLRNNRLAILENLNQLFLQVADISLLQ